MKYISGFVRDIPVSVDKTRTIPFVISTSQRDRHRTIVNIKNWQIDNYLKNPIVGYQHDVYGSNQFFPDDPDTVIGSSKITFERDLMIGHLTFETADINPLAEKIFKKVKFGSLRAASVGFLEIGKGQYGPGDESKGGKNETYYYNGQELLEWSIVKIPSNPHAVSKSHNKNDSDQVKKLLTLKLKTSHPELYGQILLEEAERYKYTNPALHREKKVEALKYIHQ